MRDNQGPCPNTSLIIQSHESHNSETTECFFYNMNRPILPHYIPNGKTSIYFGYNFKKPLQPTSLHAKLLSIEMVHYTGVIADNVLPANLRTLVLGDKFNHPITLPLSLQALRLGINYSHYCVFPNSLRQLEFNPVSMVGPVAEGRHIYYPPLRFLSVYACNAGSCTNTSCSQFPSTLETLEIGSGVVPRYIDGLTNLTSLHLGSRVNHDFSGITINTTQPIVLPLSLTSLTLGAVDRWCNKCPTFSPNVFQLSNHGCLHLHTLSFDSDSRFNESLVVPDCLLVLKLGNCFDQPIALNKLHSVMFGDAFKHPLIVPKCLKSLQFTALSVFNHVLDLPDGLARLYLPQYYSQTIALPPSLLQLEVGYKFSQPLSTNLPRLYELRMYCKHNHHPISIPPTLTHFWHTNAEMLAKQNLKCFCQPSRYVTVEKRWTIFEELVAYVFDPDRIIALSKHYNVSFQLYCQLLS